MFATIVAVTVVVVGIPLLLMLAGLR